MLKENVLDSQVRDRDEADPPDLPGVLGLGGERLNEEDEGKRRSERSANARHATIDAGRLSTAAILFRPSILRKPPRMLRSWEATTLPSSIRSAAREGGAGRLDRPVLPLLRFDHAVWWGWIYHGGPNSTFVHACGLPNNPDCLDNSGDIRD